MLENGVWSSLNPNQNMEITTNRITQTVAPINNTPSQLFALSEPTSTMSLPTLWRNLKYTREVGIPSGRLAVDFHSRFSKPMLCLIMALLAIPFAVRLRRGGIAIGFGVSIVLGLVYMFLFFAVQGLGYVDRVSAPTAAWFANIVFLVAGLVLLKRTPT